MLKSPAKPRFCCITINNIDLERKKINRKSQQQNDKDKTIDDINNTNNRHGINTHTYPLAQLMKVSVFEKKKKKQEDEQKVSKEYEIKGLVDRLFSLNFFFFP